MTIGRWVITEPMTGVRRGSMAVEVDDRGTVSVDVRWGAS